MNTRKKHNMHEDEDEDTAPVVKSDSERLDDLENQLKELVAKLKTKIYGI